MLRRREDQRRGFEHVRQCAGIILRVGPLLGECHVSGFVDEFAELPVGNGSAIDSEAVHRNRMNRRLFRIMLVGSHAERAAGYPDHVRRRGRLRPLYRRQASVAHGLLPQAQPTLSPRLAKPNRLKDDKHRVVPFCTPLCRRSVLLHAKPLATLPVA